MSPHSVGSSEEKVPDRNLCDQSNS